MKSSFKTSLFAIVALSFAGCPQITPSPVPQAILMVSSSSISLDSVGDGATIEVWNGDDSGTTLNFTATVDADWIVLSQIAGASTDPSDRETVSVSVNESELSKADFDGLIMIESNVGSTTVLVELTIEDSGEGEGGGPSPSLAVPLMQESPVGGMLEESENHYFRVEGEFGSRFNVSVTGVAGVDIDIITLLEDELLYEGDRQSDMEDHISFMTATNASNIIRVSGAEPGAYSLMLTEANERAEVVIAGFDDPSDPLLATAETEDGTLIGMFATKDPSGNIRSFDAVVGIGASGEELVILLDSSNLPSVAIENATQQTLFGNWQLSPDGGTVDIIVLETGQEPRFIAALPIDAALSQSLLNISEKSFEDDPEKVSNTEFWAAVQFGATMSGVGLDLFFTVKDFYSGNVPGFISNLIFLAGDTAAAISDDEEDDIRSIRANVAVCSALRQWANCASAALTALALEAGERSEAATEDALWLRVTNESGDRIRSIELAQHIISAEIVVRDFEGIPMDHDDLGERYDVSVEDTNLLDVSPFLGEEGVFQLVLLQQQVDQSLSTNLIINNLDLPSQVPIKIPVFVSGPLEIKLTPDELVFGDNSPAQRVLVTSKNDSHPIAWVLNDPAAVPGWLHISTTGGQPAVENEFYVGVVNPEPGATATVVVDKFSQGEFPLQDSANLTIQVDQPDLVVNPHRWSYFTFTTAEVEVSDGVPVIEGSRFFVQTNIENIGGYRAGASTARLFLTCADQGEELRQVGTDMTVEPLNGSTGVLNNDNQTIRWEFDLPDLGTSEYELRAVVHVDVGNVVAERPDGEGTEKNEFVADRSFTVIDEIVRDSNLSIDPTSIRFSPDSVVEGGKTTVSGQLVNAGTTTIPAGIARLTLVNGSNQSAARDIPFVAITGRGSLQVEWVIDSVPDLGDESLYTVRAAVELNPAGSAALPCDGGGAVVTSTDSLTVTQATSGCSATRPDVGTLTPVNGIWRIEEHYTDRETVVCDDLPAMRSTEWNIDGTLTITDGTWTYALSASSEYSNCEGETIRNTWEESGMGTIEPGTVAECFGAVGELCSTLAITGSVSCKICETVDGQLICDDTMPTPVTAIRYRYLEDGCEVIDHFNGCFLNVFYEWKR